jgi:regulation of enolase protein 1 (concanavalin A-like superfamily)
MKTNQAPHQTHRIIGITLLFLALSLSAWAQGLTNNFGVSFDYHANGIVGDTNWDGVYLAFGDVPNGNNGGDVNGFTTNADANMTVPNALNYQGTGGSWAAAGDDGFFIWKYVTGDFDASVEILGPYPQIAYQFAGLMVRLYDTNNSGSPFSYQTNTPLENQTWLARFQQFGNAVDARWTTNGVDSGDHPFVGSDTNRSAGDNRFYRINRTGSTFTYYYKTNSGDAWSMLTSASLPSISGPVQVGIMDADFTANSAGAVFADFELVAASVSFPALPPAPSALVTTATNTSGSLTLSWTKGNAGDNSLVVMQAGGNIPCNPIQGLTYAANASFGSAGSQLGNANEYVVYNGSGNSVTVSNLAGNNTIYTVAVYEYTNDAPVYNTASPATNNFAGPGIITSVSVSLSPTNIPVGGVGIAKLIASFSTGQVADESANPLTTWSQTDGTIVQVNTDGTVNGITNGSTTITGTFGPLNGSQGITVHSPAFTDNFGTSHDYVVNGLEGTTWDGLFLNFGDVPGPNAGPDNVQGQTLTMDANVSTNNELSFSGLGGTWRSGGNDGMFLHKIITGDFQVSVHINAMNTLNFNAAGVMARLFFNPLGLGPVGGGGGAGGSETHVEWWKIQAGALSRRYTINGTHTGLLPGSEQAGLNTTDTWLLMQRVNSTNFYFYERGSSNGVWSAVPAAACVISEAASNAPMEVGISQEMRQATVGTVQFDTLMLDGPNMNVPNASTPLPVSNLQGTLNGDLSMTFHWVASDGAGNPVRSCLVLRAGGPVTAQPNPFIGANFGGGSWSFGTGPSLGSSNFIVYVTSFPASATTNDSATVTGLTPGTVYYAAVFPFVGSGGTKNFNAVLPASGATGSLQDGALQFLTIPSLPGIPLGGLQIVQVLGHYQGGAVVNISAFATLTSSNSAIVAVTNGAASGMSLGSTTLTVVYGGFTNLVNATVRPPSFTDEFNVSHDYVANHTAGSPWDSVYLNQGDIPETGFTTANPGTTVSADANTSSNNVLTVTNANSGWAGGRNDGFFLFKYVPGDFQIAVHVLNYQILAYNEAGLLARLYSAGTNGTDIGAPFVLGNSTNAAGNAQFNGETWVGFTKFDEFNIGTYARKNIDNDEFQYGQNNQNSPDNWLLILRQNDTNFFFFERATNTEPWRLTPGRVSFSGSLALPDFAGQPMQVGLQMTPYDLVPGLDMYGQFEHFMLDRTSGSPLSIVQSGANVIVSWPPIPGTLQTSLLVSPTSWSTVPGTPTLVNGQYQMTIPIAPHNTSFFRLVQ